MRTLPGACNGLRSLPLWPILSLRSPLPSCAVLILMVIEKMKETAGLGGVRHDELDCWRVKCDLGVLNMTLAC